MADAPEITENDEGTMIVTTRKSGDIEITAGLPEDYEKPKGFDAEDPDAWLQLMESGDATKRKSAMDMLKAIGHEPTKYIHWKKDERAHVLAAHARFDAASGGEDDEPEEKETKKKSSNKTGKSSSKTSGKSSSKPAATATVDLSEVTDRLTAIEEELATQGAFLREMHMLMRVFVTANEEVNDFVGELAEDYYGNLQVPELAGNDD